MFFVACAGINITSVSSHMDNGTMQQVEAPTGVEVIDVDKASLAYRLRCS